MTIDDELLLLLEVTRPPPPFEEDLYTLPVPAVYLRATAAPFLAILFLPIFLPIELLLC